MDLTERIENDFTYHAPSPADIVAHQLIREAGKAFALLVAEHVPVGREQSLALTQVEQAVMWANAGIARNHE